MDVTTSNCPTSWRNHFLTIKLVIHQDDHPINMPIPLRFQESLLTQRLRVQPAEEADPFFFCADCVLIWHIERFTHRIK